MGEEYVPYSAEAAAKAVSTAETNDDGSVELDRSTEEAGVYPVVLVSYHIYCQQYQDQDTADQAKAFAEYVVSEEGQEAASASAGRPARLCSAARRSASAAGCCLFAILASFAVLPRLASAGAGMRGGMREVQAGTGRGAGRRSTCDWRRHCGGSRRSSCAS